MKPTALSFSATLDAFLRALEGKNRSPLTIRAYRTDVGQFIDWFSENIYEPSPDKVERADITEYLAHLGQRGVTGVSRARKLAGIREFFLFLETHDYIDKSPAAGGETPKKEKNGRVFLRPEEYRAMLGLAGASPRDYAILQVFLQTGIRVSELCDLRLADLDPDAKTIKVRGKGQVGREIELERKGLEAIKNYQNVRPETDDHLFLNKDGEPISERMVRKIVVRYKTRAGITKKASCHSLRHTFATYKAERGVRLFSFSNGWGMPI